MAGDSRRGGRVRTRINAEVRARRLPCALCGYPIDHTLNRIGRRHPLASVIDEWFPLSKGGEVSLTNCVDTHSVCNAIKSDHWPVTAEMQARCRAEVQALMAGSKVHTRTW